MPGNMSTILRINDVPIMDYTSNIVSYNDEYLFKNDTWNL